MSGSNEYRCDVEVVEFLERQELPLAALKVVHACCFLVDQDPRYNLQRMSLRKDLCFNARCKIIMQITGSPGANDNRMIEEGIRDLSGKAIFERIEISENRQNISFRFSKKFITAASPTKGSRFAMVNTAAIANLRSSAQIYFYTRAAMVERANYPNFYLPGISEEAPWRSNKRTWLRAAEKVSALLGHDYVIIPELDPSQAYASSVKVKIVTPETEWSDGRLYPRYGSEAVSIVTGGRSYTLTSKELKARRAWTKVPPPKR
ncbi:hypothetical protein [Limimaricola soesokkakensis]|uniref:hypothetical protein n=1 Tax=Limimaricola soesokkakensis TaxID=1343159 RepID=UPI0035113229